MEFWEKLCSIKEASEGSLSSSGPLPVCSACHFCYSSHPVAIIVWLEYSGLFTALPASPSPHHTAGEKL